MRKRHLSAKWLENSFNPFRKTARNFSRWKSQLVLASILHEIVSLWSKHKGCLKQAKHKGEDVLLCLPSKYRPWELTAQHSPRNCRCSARGPCAQQHESTLLSSQGSTHTPWAGKSASLLPNSRATQREKLQATCFCGSWDKAPY